MSTTKRPLGELRRHADLCDHCWFNAGDTTATLRLGSAIRLQPSLASSTITRVLMVGREATISALRQPP